MLAVSSPLRGPFRYELVPQATQADGLCALGLCQFKAVGLVQVVDLLVRSGGTKLFVGVADLAGGHTVVLLEDA